MRSLLHPLAILMLLAVAPSARAATITVTAPAADVTVPDGDDFATTVLGDPWDFDKRRDFLFEDHVTNVAVAGGNWSATVTGSGAVVYPLFQGFPAALKERNLDMPEFGVHRPIDASRYTELSYRLNVSDRQAFGIAWTRNDDFPVACGQYATCNPQAGAVSSPDGFYLPGAFVPYSGWTIYDFNLADRSGFLGQYGVDWSGQITGLQLAPSASAGAGATLEFDWMRLVDPTTSPVVPIHWSTAGAPSDATVNVVVDGSGGASCGGEVIARQVPNTGQYDLRTAKLPPGRWRVSLQLVQLNASQTALNLLGSSGCSAAITIAQAPTLDFTAPSPTSGVDYATSEIGNPWDMNDPTDLLNFGLPMDQRYFDNATFSNGVFRATAIAPGAHSPYSDVTLLMNGPQITPINTEKYRWLTWRMWADTSHFNGIADYLTRGGGLRTIFFDQGLGSDGTDSRATLVYEDWHEHAIDLFDPNLPDPDDKNAANIGWQQVPFVSTFHIDPLEVVISSDFAFDDIGLHAEDCTAGPYTARWTIVDPASPSLSVDLYAAAAQSGGDATHLAGPVTVAAGDGSADANLGLLPDGRWYLRAVVSDGLQTRTFASRVPIVKPCPDFAPPVLDPRTGTWSSTAGGYSARAAKSAPAVAVFPSLPNADARIGAQAVAKHGQPLLVFGYASATDFYYVQVDARKRRVAAFHQSGGKRTRLKAGRLAKSRRGRSKTVALGLTIANGSVRADVGGAAALELPDPGVAGPVGFGVTNRGVGQFTGLRGRRATAGP